MGARRRRKKRSLADQADRHTLYQQAVQSPEGDIEYFLQWFESYRGRIPRRLREDFCGTALLSCAWVEGDESRHALGVDLDAEVLNWAREHNLARLDAGALRRLRLLHSDVRQVTSPRVDIACAMNFSFCVFKERAELVRYFQAVRKGLFNHGMFVCEMYGGTEAIIAAEERRELDEATYVWEQISFNPITNETLCAIHFEFPDRSRLRGAFTYDWRLWSLPELSDALSEAGFSSIHFWWEEVDEEGDGTGVYRETREEENQETYLVYVVALA